MKRARIVLLFLGLLCLAGAGIGFGFYRYATTPVQSSERTVMVWIRPGQTFSETVFQLKDMGLVRHPKKFRWLAFLKGDERQIKAGEYRLFTTMSPQGILKTLVRGKVFLRKVVIPEGSTTRDIGQFLERAGLVSQERFLEAVSDPRLVKALGVGGGNFEGYLFPETYHFPRGISPEEIIRTMVFQFRSVFTPEWTERARTMGFTTHEVTTLASIVEKETGEPEERPLIAAVFLNRLKRGMELESDPTVIYGIKAFDGDLTRRDLEAFTPYNTYCIYGLPPGPIANPGRASIEAVLYPSEQPYLYFVSKNDGSHHFSSTLTEHKKMVDLYQRRTSGRCQLERLLFGRQSGLLASAVLHHGLPSKGPRRRHRGEEHV